MAKGNKPAANPGQQRVLISRVFDAPADRVFSLWTNPAYLEKWWGPGNTIHSSCEMDVRVGGKISIVLQMEDGPAVPVAGVFNEVSEPDRLVFTIIQSDAQGNTAMEVLHTVTLTKEGAKTRLLMQIDVIRTNPALKTSCLGLEPGWKQSLDRMAAQLNQVMH